MIYIPYLSQFQPLCKLEVGPTLTLTFLIFRTSLVLHHLGTRYSRGTTFLEARTLPRRNSSANGHYLSLMFREADPDLTSAKQIHAPHICEAVSFSPKIYETDPHAHEDVPP